MTGSTDGRITPEDIKSKLHEIQGDALEQVEEAKSRLVTIGAGVALIVLIVAFLLGKRAGKRASTVIEVRRA